MTSVIGGLDAKHYRRHALHDLARDWPETNCYVDLLIEVIASYGGDPVSGLGFTVLQDFEGDQFTFFKFPASTLETLYGLSVLELGIFDTVAQHLTIQVERGRLPLIEVDAFYLPDTAGLTYGREHSKTTIGVNCISIVDRHLSYFHNAGYFTLKGEDFDGLFPKLTLENAGIGSLLPYTEFVKFGALTRTVSTVDAAVTIMRAHLAGRPGANPISKYKLQIGQDIERLSISAPSAFHKYTFHNLRQLGANHELLSSHLSWLRQAGIGGLDRAIAASQDISTTAKALQFQLARCVMRRGKQTCDDALDRMANSYTLAIGDVLAAFDTPSDPVINPKVDACLPG
jgi:hypothetical protein